jgi:hypothetical protein
MKKKMVARRRRSRGKKEKGEGGRHYLDGGERRR